ncbi:MAG TPA: dTMP kinase [Acidimicrobiales bacterium]
MTARGRLIAFEGIDGSGKSTQVRRVAADRGALCTFEPGDTELGAALRAVALHGTATMTPLAELLVMAADRAQHVAQVIEPALADGRDVVCDRFDGSTLAYQGYGRGLDLDEIRAVLSVATGGMSPDATVLLDCPVADALRRVAGDDGTPDRFEGDERFLGRVRDGFLALADLGSWIVVDATLPVDEVARLVDERLAASVR